MKTMPPPGDGTPFHRYRGDPPCPTTRAAKAMKPPGGMGYNTGGPPALERGRPRDTGGIRGDSRAWGESGSPARSPHLVVLLLARLTSRPNILVRYYPRRRAETTGPCKRRDAAISPEALPSSHPRYYPDNTMSGGSRGTGSQTGVAHSPSAKGVYFPPPTSRLTGARRTRRVVVAATSTRRRLPHAGVQAEQQPGHATSSQANLATKLNVVHRLPSFD